MDISILGEFLNEYLTQGYVSEVDPASLKGCFPIKLVPKKQGSYRIVHDLRNLNQFFAPPAFDLPSPMAPLINAYQWCAKVDITNCFLQFPLAADFSYYFGFKVEGRAFKFNVLPFGWNLSPYLVTKFLRPI